MAKMTRNEIEDSRDHLKAWFPNQSVERHTFNKICDQAVIAARPEAELPNAMWLAKFFHDTYERLAPQYGYETRQDTRQFDHESPNGRLMAAVCEELRSACDGDSQP